MTKLNFGFLILLVICSDVLTFRSKKMGTLLSLRQDAEQTTTEQTPAEQAQTEQTPAEQTPAEQASAEQTPTEQAPAEQTQTEQAATEQTATEKKHLRDPDSSNLSSSGKIKSNELY